MGDLAAAALHQSSVCLCLMRARAPMRQRSTGLGLGVSGPAGDARVWAGCSAGPGAAHGPPWGHPERIREAPGAAPGVDPLVGQALVPCRLRSECARGTAAAAAAPGQQSRGTRQPTQQRHRTSGSVLGAPSSAFCSKCGLGRFAAELRRRASRRAWDARTGAVSQLARPAAAWLAARPSPAVDEWTVGTELLPAARPTLLAGRAARRRALAVQLRSTARAHSRRCIPTCLKPCTTTTSRTTRCGRTGAAACSARRRGPATASPSPAAPASGGKAAPSPAARSGSASRPPWSARIPDGRCSSSSQRPAAA